MTVKKDDGDKFPIQTLADLRRAFTAPVRRLTGARVIASGDTIVVALKSGRLFSNCVNVRRYRSTNLHANYSHETVVHLLLKAKLITQAAYDEYQAEVVARRDRDERDWDLKRLREINTRYGLGVKRDQMDLVQRGKRHDDTRKRYER